MVQFPFDVLDIVVHIRDRRQMVVTDRTLRKTVDENQAALVCLHAKWEWRRQSVDPCLLDALQDAQKFTKVNCHLLLAQR